MHQIIWSTILSVAAAKANVILGAALVESPMSAAQFYAHALKTTNFLEDASDNLSDESDNENSDIDSWQLNSHYLIQ